MKFWKLGNHRLVCGDARKAEARELLYRDTGIEKADLGLHDPPYGLRAAKIALCGGDGKQYGKSISHRNVFKPLQGDNKPLDASQIASILEGAKITILWGANFYADKLPVRPSWLIWDKREHLPSNDQSDCELAWISGGGNRAMIFRHYWNGLIKRSEIGIKRVHPTQKPIALFRYCIEKYTRPGDSVCDWYAGRATTILAAEECDRKAFCIEIDEDYCNIAIDQWEKKTGLKAELMEYE